MIKRLSLYIIACLAVINAYSQNTVYYKLTNIQDNKSSLKIQGGQFITFISDICYESDNKGIGVGHGTLKYNPNYSTSSVKKYTGSSYWGKEAVYAFNADKSVLNVVLESGMILVYKRSTPPNGVYTCSLIKPSEDNFEYSGDPYNPINPIPQPSPYPVPTPTPEPNPEPTPPKHWKTITYQEDCHFCHGLGKCWTCNGNGWCYNEFGLDGTHDCPNCTNGNCTHCNGTGKVTKTKQVYE